ncbi:M48 family metallopeptidase [Xylanibacter ruminicola]|uniref:Peptidase family M48 n=1 Tax=Xylanibacter ruminicola TaxID=839 RepID=A0A1M6WPD0_XYLRU|nr:M48 family metallopeptidase [Xylanibacter ruminicola]SHK95548.1 Peptidase family M48 [Xylanibacter ruminicola]
MKKVKFFIMSMVAVLLVSCGTTNTVPITGRKQRLMVSDGEVLTLSTQQYQEFMKSAKLSTNATNTAMVKRVGTNLANAVVNFLNENGMQNDVQNYQWTFNLVADNQANAWCMPGGLIVVYEGLLPITKDEASLAIVLGHEIAHAVARHSAEQMSKQIQQQYGVQGAGVLASILGVGDNTIALGQAAAAQGLSFLNLKYSRDNENEADHLGLIFAAMAGYDPSVAVSFWERMSAASGNKSTAEFLSDHPSDATRIKNIQGWLPEAQKYYKPKTTTTTTKKTTTKKTTTKKKK